jgi:pimeloyl-ACP methyl ester carboxylesterase
MGRSKDEAGSTFPYATRHLDTPYGRVAVMDEGGRGEVVILVHGLVGDFTHFEHVIPRLVPSARVIGIDMPGCGASDSPKRGPHSIDCYARTVLHVMSMLDIDRATLVGHSAGGQVCATAASMAPRRVARLVLLNPSGLRGYPRPIRLVTRLALHPRLVAALLGATAHRILDFIFHQKNEFTEHFARSQVGREPRKDLLHNMGRVFRDLVPELMSAAVVELADDLVMPVLVIWGDRDRLVPLAMVRDVVTKIRTARLEVIERCGHMPMIEYPEETARLILRFLNEHPARRATADAVS